jgi:hypothetical protein
MLKPLVLSLLSGSLFSCGWCLLVDGIVSAAPGVFLWYFAVPAVLTTAGAILVNFIYAHQIRTTSSVRFFDDTDVNLIYARIWFYVMLTISLCGIFGALWIVLDHFIAVKDPWPGIALQLQTILVTLSGFCFFFGRGVK